MRKFIPLLLFLFFISGCLGRYAPVTKEYLQDQLYFYAKKEELRKLNEKFFGIAEKQDGYLAKNQIIELITKIIENLPSSGGEQMALFLKMLEKSEANKIRAFIETQGGGTGSMDAISCDDLVTNDLVLALDVNSSRFIPYKYNNDGSCESDNEPDTIAPDDCATCSNKGQWEKLDPISMKDGMLVDADMANNALDPDKLIGDSTDDDMMDVNLLGPFGAMQMDGTPGSDDTYAGATITGWNCGESVEQWDLVYLDDTENEWMEADADAAGKFPAVGMAVAACTNGNPGTILLWGIIRNDDWNWSENGKKLYLDETTTGGLTETAPSTTGDCVQLKAYSLDDDHIILFPTIHYLEAE